MQNPNHVSAIPGELTSLRVRANDLYAERRISEALALYQQGFAFAEGMQNIRAQSGFALGIANCLAYQFRFQRAADFYRQSRTFAQASGRQDVDAAAAISLSNLYLRMGSIDPAAAALARVKIPPNGVPFASRLHFQLQSATLARANQDLAASEDWLRQAVRTAETEGDLISQARTYDSLGDLLIDVQRLDEAEPLLMQGFYLRRLDAPRHLGSSYFHLSRLFLERKQLKQAELCLERALSLARSDPATAPLWSLYHQRARLRIAAGKVPDARQDLKRAIDSAERWRADLVPSAHVRDQADSEMDRIYERFIALSMDLYDRSGNPRFAFEALEAAQRNRARTLREGPRFSAELPPDYWRKLEQLRSAEIQVLQESTPDHRASANQLMLEVVELESRYLRIQPASSLEKSESNPSLSPLRVIQSLVGSEDAWLIFHIGAERAYRWALTHNRIQVLALPTRQVLKQQIQAFRSAISTGEGWRAQAASLYSTLFGDLGPEFRNKRQWTLDLDGDLFALPFAALITPEGRFLAQSCALRTVPAVLERLAPPVRETRGFLSAGDAVYNQADPRWKDPRPLWRQWKRLPGLELPRLPGSGEEAQVSASLWTGQGRTVLMTGMEISRNRLHEELEKGPAVVHLALHVVAPEEHSDQTSLALGLDPDGRFDFLTPTEIARSHFPVGLAVLSGCGSGLGKTLPGSGLLGLSRAWLSAGTRAVLASLWPVGDNSAEFFSSFYRSYGLQPDSNPAAAASRALQMAQLEMVERGGWQSDPSHWAAYTVVGQR